MPPPCASVTPARGRREPVSDAPALDRRVTPARPDLAARRLEGIVAADRYVDGEMRQVVAASAPLHRAPRFDAALDSEALAGDRVTVYEETIEGWAWGELSRDGYVGYLPADMLGPPDPAPTHRVAALRTFRYPGPDLKLPSLGHLSMAAGVTVVREEERRGTLYAVLADGGGAVIARHLEPIDARAADFVTVAERMVCTPYLWGGATTLGLDCSGLVQLSLRMAGVASRRDSDQQEAALGEPLPLDAAPLDGRRSRLTRGDLLFWPGHVGLMLDESRLLHASGFHMEVVAEPVTEALARIGAAGSALRTVRRLSGIGLPASDDADRHFFNALAWRINEVMGSGGNARGGPSVDDILPDRRGLGGDTLELSAVAFMLGGKSDRFTALLRFTPETAAAFRHGRRSTDFTHDDPALWLHFDAERRHLVVTVHR
jgi:cell wall-associated NlpC family hydrolase